MTLQKQKKSEIYITINLKKKIQFIIKLSTKRLNLRNIKEKS